MWPADPRGRAVPVLLLGSGELPRHSRASLLPSPHTTKPVSPQFQRGADQAKLLESSATTQVNQGREAWTGPSCLLAKGGTNATSGSLSLSQRQGLPTFFPGRLCSELPLRAERAGTSEVLWEFSRAAEWLPRPRAVWAHSCLGPYWAAAGNQQSFGCPTSMGKIKLHILTIIALDIFPTLSLTDAPVKHFWGGGALMCTHIP